MGHRLREPLDRPFTRTIKTEKRHAALRANARDLLNQSARRTLLVAHHLHRGARNVQHAKEIDLHLSSDLGLGVFLEAAGEPVARIVDDDVDAGEFREGRAEGGGDASFVAYIESQGEVVVWRGVAETELRWVAGGGHHVFSAVQYFLRVEFPEAGRGPGYEEYSWHIGSWFSGGGGADVEQRVSQQVSELIRS